jgi:hypothetical protein
MIDAPGPGCPPGSARLPSPAKPPRGAPDPARSERRRSAAPGCVSVGGNRHAVKAGGRAILRRAGRSRLKAKCRPVSNTSRWAAAGRAGCDMGSVKEASPTMPRNPAQLRGFGRRRAVQCGEPWALATSTSVAELLAGVADCGDDRVQEAATGELQWPGEDLA